nr:TonB-dependent receptor [Halomonas gudaonensis]
MSPNDSYSVTDEAFSGQIGFMYQFDSGLSPYLNYSNTFVPARQVSAASGKALDPITGRQYELGLRYEVPKTDTSMTLSAYDIVKKNDVNYDANQGIYRNIGRTESQGLEFELVSELSEGLRLTASYTYTDARVVKDEAFPRYEGNQVAGVPRHQASLWAHYRRDERPAGWR